MIQELTDTTASELVSLMAAGELSPVEVTDHYLARIAERNPPLNAFCLVAASTARASAADAERALLAREAVGPLNGIPVAIKDATPTAGLRTTFGSRAFADYVPAEDATTIGRLREAGAILIGKTTTPEFGLKGVCDSPLLGRTNNPWDPRRTSGGSSGGAAAAVAAEMTPLAEGSDGGGSVRIPASACGVVGLKPSFGLLPLHPRNPFESLVHQGALARSVRDVGLLLGAMAGPAMREVYGLSGPVGGFEQAVSRADVRGWRIAFSRDLGIGPVDEEVATRIEQAARIFEQLGADVEEATPDVPDPREPFMVIWKTIYAHIARQRVLPVVGRQGMDPDLARLMDAAGAYQAEDFYEAAFAFRHRFFLAMMDFFSDRRLLLAPTLSRPAVTHPDDGLNPLGAQGSEAERFLAWFRTYHFNLTGQPAVTVPCALSSDGLPIGLQLIGRPRADADVLCAAAAYEQARPWRHLRPPEPTLSALSGPSALVV